MRGEKNVKDTRRNFPFEIPTIPSVAIVLLAPLLFEHSRLEINKIAQRNVISSPRRDDLIGPCYWSILDFSIITRDGSATRPQTEREREREIVSGQRIWSFASGHLLMSRTLSFPELCSTIYPVAYIRPRDRNHHGFPFDPRCDKIPRRLWDC